MTPERRHRVEQLVHAALARPPDERRRFLEEVCGDDAELLREVESLLGDDTLMGSLVETPRLEMAAADGAAGRSGRLAGQRLGAYEVVRLLGAGGMGEVYLARDTRLRRNVALKLLPPAFAQEDEWVRRFVQEARAASMLNHPNILTIFEIGQEDDTRFIAAELVDGVSLRERICRGTMGAREVVDIGVQIASALAAAHRAGIVHRDLKPENVMLRPDGYVKVLDFGLAKLTERRSGSADADSGMSSWLDTAPGMVLGTVAYMSPEQLRAQELDARTDLFSLGVVLYEMVAGRRPFAGETASDLMVATLKSEPAPLGRDAEGVPPELERIVAKALEKDRDDRYQRAEDLLADLKELERDLELAEKIERSPRTERRPAAEVTAAMSEASRPAGSGEEAAVRTAPGAGLRRRTVRLAGAALALATLSAAAYLAYLAARPDAMTSIAVLPFANGTSDQELDYLSDGISESLINSLSQLPGVKVVARSSSFRYRGDTVDLRDAARALGVQGILTGRVEQRSGRLVVNVELVDTRDNTHAWGERYDRRPEDLLALQAEISREIADKLRVRLGAGEQNARRDEVNPEAYELYLKGRYHTNTLTPEGFKLGLEYFRRATEVDPDFAPPYAGQAEVYTLLGGVSAVPVIAPQEAIPKAKAAAARALELDETLAGAHTSLALILMTWEYDWEGAERELKRAIALSPSDVSAHHWYSHYLVATERLDESLAESERALAIDPLDASINAHLGFHFIFARQYDRAIAQLEKTLEMSPRSRMALGLLGVAYTQSGRYDEAVAAYLKLRELGGFDARGLLGYTYAVSGRRGEAQRLLGELLEESARKYVSPANVALIHAGLGDADQVFAWLEKAYVERDSNIYDVARNPQFDAFRSDPRFADLLRRMGLSGSSQ